MMVWRVIGYEMKRSLHYYVVWAAIAVILAFLARMQIFSLTDMPLFYLMLFGSVGIMIGRYNSTMHGAEAAFLFTTDMSPKEHMFARYCAALILSIITALMTGAVLRIQGEELSKILRNVSFPMGLMLTAEVTFSAFALFAEISAAWTLSNIRPFSQCPTACFVVFGAMLICGNSILPAMTKHLIPAYLVIAESGSVFVSTVSDMPASVSFSLNTLVWNVICTVIIITCIPAIIRKKLLIVK